MTEAQRAAAISIAEVPNTISVLGTQHRLLKLRVPVVLTPMTGPNAPDPDFSRYWDPGPLVLDVVPGGALDIAQNPNAAISTCVFTGCNRCHQGHQNVFALCGAFKLVGFLTQSNRLSVVLNLILAQGK